MALLSPGESLSHFSQIENKCLEQNKAFFDVLEGKVGKLRNVKLRCCKPTQPGFCEMIEERRKGKRRRKKNMPSFLLQALKRTKILEDYFSSRS